MFTISSSAPSWQCTPPQARAHSPRSDRKTSGKRLGVPTKTLGTPVARSARKKRLALQCVAWASLAGPLPHLLVFARDGIPTQSNKLPTTAQWTCELGLPLLRVDLLRWRCCGWFLLLVVFGHAFFRRNAGSGNRRPAPSWKNEQQLRMIL